MLQSNAVKNANATIRDRYYNSASCTPRSVFGSLMRLHVHHLGKVEKGRAVFFEKEIQDVIEGIQEFPANLNLEQQSLFAIGYYHQKQDFFTKKPNQGEDK